jgi:hypothetical protein
LPTVERTTVGNSVATGPFSSILFGKDPSNSGSAADADADAAALRASAAANPASNFLAVDLMQATFLVSFSAPVLQRPEFSSALV